MTEATACLTCVTRAAPQRPSDFSIDHILRRAGPRPPPPGATAAAAPDHDQWHFEWLQCTRYRPPRLQRSKRKEGSSRRRLGRNPRIPFTTAQVEVLEDKFRSSPYLSASDVSHLSTLLRLSDARIKIWFQNRRARERRDNGKVGQSPPPRQQPQGPVKSAFTALPSPLPHMRSQGSSEGPMRRPPVLTLGPAARTTSQDSLHSPTRSTTSFTHQRVNDQKIESVLTLLERTDCT